MPAGSSSTKMAPWSPASFDLTRLSLNGLGSSLPFLPSASRGNKTVVMEQMFLITQHRTYRVMQRKLMYCLNENSCFRGASAAQSALAYTGVPQYIKLMVLAMLESVTLKYIEEIFGKSYLYS